MERGLMMLLHSLLIGLLLYILMVFLLGQRPSVAEDRSMLIAAMVLMYMILFGHRWPRWSAINRNIM